MFQIITGSRFGSSKNDLRCPCYLNFKLLFFQILLTSQMRWFWSANFGLKRSDFFLVFLFSFWGSCSRSMHFLCHPAHKKCSFLTSDQNEVACDPPKHTSSKKKNEGKWSFYRHVKKEAEFSKAENSTNFDVFCG